MISLLCCSGFEEFMSRRRPTDRLWAIEYTISINFVLVSSNRCIYVFGGDAKTSSRGTVACYHIQENNWEIKENLMPVSG